MCECVFQSMKSDCGKSSFKKRTKRDKRECDFEHVNVSQHTCMLNNHVPTIRESQFKLKNEHREGTF